MYTVLPIVPFIFSPQSRTPVSSSYRSSPNATNRAFGGGKSRTPLSSRTTSRTPSANMSASRKLLRRSRRSISQPNLPKTPISHRTLTPLLKGNSAIRRSAGRTPKADVAIERKRHKRMCSSPESAVTPDISLRYNPITHEMNEYDCSPIAMPSEPNFKADEYGASPSSVTLTKAKSVNSLLYGSPSKKPTNTPRHKQEPNYDSSSTSTPLQKAKSMNSLFMGEQQTPTDRTPTRAHPDGLFGFDKGDESPLGSPRSASPLFVPIVRPADPPPPPPKAAGALFQSEPLNTEV